MSNSNVDQHNNSIFSGGNRFAIMGLLLLGWVFILYVYAVRVSESVIIQPLMAAFQVGPTQIGILSSAYYIPYVLMQIPAGMIIDKFGLLKSWFVALLLVAIGCYLFSISNTLTLAFWARIFIGCGSAFAWVGIVNLVVSLFHKKRQNLFIGISMTLCMLGAVVGQEPWLLLTNFLESWQRPYFIAMIVGIVLAVAMLAIRQKNLSLKLSVTKTTFGEIFRSLKPIVKSKLFWIFAFYITMVSLPQNAFTALWAVEYLKQSYGLNPNVAASIVSSVWLGGVLGAPVIGYFSGRVHHQKTLLILFNVLTIVLTSLLIFIKIKSLFLLLATLFSIGFVTNVSVIIYGKAAELGGEKAGATVVSAINMLNMGGAALVQVFMGYILSITNAPGELTHFTAALCIMPITVFLSLLPFIKLDLRNCVKKNGVIL